MRNLAIFFVYWNIIKIDYRLLKWNIWIQVGLGINVLWRRMKIIVQKYVENEGNKTKGNIYLLVAYARYISSAMLILNLNL